MSSRNLVVAFGGVSPEHEVSVLTAMQVIASLKETNYNIIPLYISKSGRWLTGDLLLEMENYQDLDELKEEATHCTFSHDNLGQPVLLETEKKGLFSSPESYTIHALIPAFHGSEGENGAFQGTCEMYNIPYAGSNVLASSLGMDKIKAKDICRAHDLPIVEGFDFYESEWVKDQQSILKFAEQLGYPVILKPVNLGSSIGVSRAEHKDELIEAIETAFRYDENLMVERAISPLLEINCSVLGTAHDLQTSVCERPLGEDETLSFEDKYQSDNGSQKGMASADREIPADISDELTQKIQSLSEKIFKLFRASGIARLDFLVNADTEELYFNEINTIPGSFSFYLWEESGMNMRELMLKLIDIATEQHKKKVGRIRSYDTNLLNEKAVKGIKGLKGTQQQGASDK
ncbi:D-alanine--D-alanine ligase [Aliifodinibius salipaludis]|uniref:D-alanine--D-alanine ligase n=1 Tax=Fodinibius salipaludis TaxID=2032627 RepID=A0A2A2GAD5_9BACT|nr:D-alanine--D-alanine ligase family protein [Aliifodinibius salipaludis]PAU94541.1 D-alanine--D-alanine ligase [Aliifodinibius salipaludis]